MRKLSFWILLRLSVFPLLAQQATDRLITKFDSLRKNEIQEKLYIHTDRTFYLTGETIWFKIYITDASFHHNLDISKVAYLELIDSQNTPVLQVKIAIDKGLGSGSLFIPATLTSGNLFLRAYTSWMKNTAPDFYFHKPITVINPFLKIETHSAESNSSIQASFFPEGGTYIIGLKSKIAFKVTDQFSHGIAFKGAVINSNNDTVSFFNPSHLGMGYFYFTPDGKKYRAVVKLSKKNTKIFDLPAPLPKGTVMTTSAHSNHFEFSINSTQNNGQVHLFVHARQVIVRSESQQLRSGKATFKIRKDELLEGISHITLFDSLQQPVAERLLFKKPEEKLKIRLGNLQPEYQKREKITLELNSNLSANLSLKVDRIDSLPDLPDENIEEYMWLTSDLTGKIEDPTFYFNQDSVFSNSADILMLTQAWKRFKWNELNKKPSIPPEFHGHIVRGKVYDQSGAPASAVMTYLSSPVRSGRVYGATSDANGNLAFELNDLKGTTQLSASTHYPSDSIYHIKVSDPFSDQFASLPVPTFFLPSKYEEKLLQRSIAMQAHNIYQKNKESHSSIPIDSVPFYGKADEIYYLDDFTRFPLMEEVMREYVHGVTVRKRKDKFSFRVIDKLNKNIFDGDPMILLNGLPIFDATQIIELDPLKVKRLEVLDRTYHLGPLRFSGLIAYYTYDADWSEASMFKKKIIEYDGLQKERRFYSPTYVNGHERGRRSPDQRTLLYWNPSITIRKDSHSIEFFTSDLSGTYRITIQGISEDGNPASSIHYFSVRDHLLDLH